MRSPFRWLLRRNEYEMLRARARVLESEFSHELGKPCRFVPADAKGGYDQIFQVRDADGKIAVARVNNPHKKPKSGPIQRSICKPLGPRERLSREWDAYRILHPLGISPEPLWRTDDCIVCAWIPWPRASRVLVKQRDLAWSVIERSVLAIRRMHDACVTHLDLNTGNLLFNEKGPGIAVIDFEYEAGDSMSFEQQAAYDYLRIIDDFTRPRRGGKSMLSDQPRLVSLLKEQVPPCVREAPMGFVFIKLQHLAQQKELRRNLREVFVNLDV